MLLMPSNDIDFKAFASTVVDEHERTGKDIEDCLVEASEKRKLTPEEIRRLVEKTNTELSLRHLRGANKKESFRLANYDSVLARTHGADEEEVDEASEGVEKTASLPCTRKKPRVSAPLFPVGQLKVAEQHVVDSTDFFLLRKECDAAKFEKMAIEQRLNSNLEWLAKAFQQRTAPDFGKFAADAVALLGNNAAFVVRHLATVTGKKPLSKKAASLVVDDSTEHMKRMRAVCEDMTAFMKQAALVDDYEKVIAAGKAALRKFAFSDAATLPPAPTPQPGPAPATAPQSGDATDGKKPGKLSGPVRKAMYGIGLFGTAADAVSSFLGNTDKLETIPQRYF